MKENQRYKQFDLFTVLALVGTAGIILFESFFLFELYNRDFSAITSIFSAPEEAIAYVAPPIVTNSTQEILPPVEPEEVLISEDDAPVEDLFDEMFSEEESAATNAIPDAPSSIDESVPVG